MPIYPYSFTMPPVNKQDIPSDGVVGEFLGISAGGVLDWLPVAGGSGSGDLLAANNLSELTPTAGTARTNLGLGTGDSPTFANLTLTSPSLSSSAPVTISQTWNQIGTAFTAFKINAVSTASASGSLLLDLQVGTVSQFKVTKAGAVIVPSGSSSAPSLCFVDTDNGFYKTSLGIGYSTSTNTSVFTASYNGALGMLQDMFLGWSTAQFSQSNWDVRLYKDGAGQLALRNGTSAQTFRVYGAYPDTGINYARLALSCDTSGNATISTQALGTYTAGVLAFSPGNSERMRITTAGNVGIGTTSPTFKLSVQGDTECRGKLYVTQSSPTTALVFDSSTNFHRIYAEASQHIVFQTGVVGNVGIGTTSPTSKLDVVGDVNASGSITSSTNIYAGTNGYLFISGRSAIGSSIAGGHTLLDNAGSFYNRLNLGGNTNLFPAIKRVGAELQIVIASTTSAAGVAAPDADMAFIEDRYRRKGVGTPEGVVTAPIGAVYHNTTGGAGTSFYVKESGTGNTGWVGK